MRPRGLGVANLVADGFSMAVGNLLGTRAEHQQRERARHQEERHVALVPDGEREEVRQLFAAKGVAGADLERVVAVITTDRERWVDTMMREELGYGADGVDLVRAAAATLVAFVTVGALPLAVFANDAVAPGEVEDPFVWSALLTGVAFLAVGGLKARVVEQTRARAGLETLGVGGSAAALAYLVGVALQGVAQPDVSRPSVGRGGGLGRPPLAASVAYRAASLATASTAAPSRRPARRSSSARPACSRG